MPEGARLEIELRMESVMEGVLVTGAVRAPVAGECVRCLEPLADQTEADFQEMFRYPEADAVTGAAAEETDDDGEEEFLVHNDLLDLEPVLRDAVVLSLPLRPMCREDCPGLCPDCGAQLAGDPDHHHDEPVDVRWAALQELAANLGHEGDPHAHAAKYDNDTPPRSRGDDTRER